MNTKRSFGENIYNGNITVSGADKKRSNLWITILDFNCKVRPRSKANNEKRSNTYECENPVYEGWELTRYAFDSEIFPLKPT